MILHVVLEPLRRSRLAWQGSTAVLCAFLALLGGVYLANGAGAVRYTPAFVILTAIPGGLRTHGAVMVTLAVLLAACLAAFRSERLERHGRKYGPVVLFAVGLYLMWTGVAFALAPVRGGSWSWTGVTVWPTLGAIALVYAACMPPPLAYFLHRRESLISLALDKGLSNRDALALTDEYFAGTRLGGRA